MFVITKCRHFDVEFPKQFQMRKILSLNNLQIDNADTLVDSSYRCKIYNLEIVCSIAMLWLGKHIFPDKLSTLEHPLVALSTVRTILLFPMPWIAAPRYCLLFLFWYFSLILLLHSVTCLGEFSLCHPIVYQRYFCWRRTLFVHSTSRSWILNKKIWIDISTLTQWKSTRKSWKKNWTGFSSQFLKLEIIWVNWFGK